MSEPKKDRDQVLNTSLLWNCSNATLQSVVRRGGWWPIQHGVCLLWPAEWGTATDKYGRSSEITYNM